MCSAELAAMLSSLKTSVIDAIPLIKPHPALLIQIDLSTAAASVYYRRVAPFSYSMYIYSKSERVYFVQYL